jgi:hypothetical protein
MPHDGQGVEGKKKQVPSQCFCKRKKNTKNVKIMFFWGGGDGQLLADFFFSAGVLERNPREKRWLSVIGWETISA